MFKSSANNLTISSFYAKFYPFANIAEVSSGFHQADWSTTLGIVYCYPISFLFWFICLLVYRNLILTISAYCADENVSSI